MMNRSDSSTHSSDSEYLYVQCPGCDSRYRVPEQRLKAIDEPLFHCSHCDHVFEARTEAASAEQESSPATDMSEQEDRIEGSAQLALNQKQELPSPKEGQSPLTTTATPLEDPDLESSLLEPKVNTSEIESRAAAVDFDEPIPGAGDTVLDADSNEQPASSVLQESSDPSSELPRSHEELALRAKEQSSGSGELTEDKQEARPLGERSDTQGQQTLKEKEDLTPATSSVESVERLKSEQLDQTEELSQVERFAATIAALEKESAKATFAPRETNERVKSETKEPEQVQFGFLDGNPSKPLSDARAAVDPALPVSSASSSDSEREEIENDFNEEQETPGQDDTQRISPQDFHLVKGGGDSPNDTLNTAETEVLPEFQMAQHIAADRATRSVSPNRSLLLLVSPMMAFLAVLFLAGQTLATPDLQWLNEKLFPATPKAPPAELRIRSAALEAVSVADGKKAYVLRGTVHNSARESIGFIQVEGALFDSQGSIIETVRLPLGSDLSAGDLQVLSLPIINDMQRDPGFRKTVLKPNSSRDFILVFTSSKAAQARFFTSRIHSARVLE